MKTKKKRGRWFYLLTVSSSILLLSGIAGMIYLWIKSADIGLYNALGAKDFYVITIYNFISFSVALTGLMIMIITLKRMGYYLYVIGWGLVLILVIYIKLKSKELLSNEDLITYLIVIFIQILLFLPFFFLKLKKSENLKPIVDENHPVRPAPEQRTLENKAVIEDKSIVIDKKTFEKPIVNETSSHEPNIKPVDSLPKSTKKNKTLFITLGAIIILIVGGFIIWKMLDVNKKAIEEKRIVRERFLIDSLQFVAAREKFKFDSLNKVLTEQKKLEEEENQNIKDVIELFYRYTKDQSTIELARLFTNPALKYYSMTNATTEDIIDDRNQYSKKFALLAYIIDFHSLKIQKIDIGYDAFYNIEIVVYNNQDYSKTKFYETINMKLNQEFKIYSISETVNFKEKIM